MGAILIVDPYLVNPEWGVYNSIAQRISALRSQSASCTLTHPLFYAPRAQKGVSLKQAISNHTLAGIICLGSAANLTDEHPWVESLKTELLDLLIKKEIPFFGICFSHQLLGALFGFRVDYLGNRHLLPYGRYLSPRRVQVTHPKLQLLLSALPWQSHFTGNGPDLDWRDAWRTAQGFGARQWETFRSGVYLTAPEYRLHDYLRKQTTDHFYAHARHEQEVKSQWTRLDNFGFLKEDVHAARSPECEIDALVHPQLPWFGFQTHPETPCHVFKDGQKIIDQFLYLCALKDSHEL